MSEEYYLSNAKIEDIDSWMKLVYIVKDNFPGLETDEMLDIYRQTVIKNIGRETALCVKYHDEIVGVILFSLNSKCLSFLAVHPEYRRKGIASMLIEKMISLFPDNMNISVSTFRENDAKGTAPRALYKKFGFEEDELINEFDYPNQRFILHRKH